MYWRHFSLMDKRVLESTSITAEDLEFLRRIEAGIPITADVSRADLLLCTLYGGDSDRGQEPSILVAVHGMPYSISSLYRNNAEGRIFPAAEQPLILRALQSGSGGRRPREVISSGAPIIQEVYPIAGHNGSIIAALVVETTLIAHERQKRRDRHFQQAVRYLIEQCARGGMESAARLTRFGLYDGVYLVDRSRTVTYMSGIAANMFRAIGVPAVLHDQPLDVLEAVDREMVREAFSTATCDEDHFEGEDGRHWIRRSIPISISTQASSLTGRVIEVLPEWLAPNRGHFQVTPSDIEHHAVQLVMILMHNATETIAKQRELNVKAALVQEVHHRVKNNLQNIAAILRMQARRAQSEETQFALTDAVNRVLSMSVIHEYLSKGDSRSINIRDVCARIAQQVREVALSPDQRIDVQVRGPSIRLPASQATPTALVINELLLNALEHGIKDRTQGIIVVTLVDLGDAVRMEVADDGAGLPEGFAVNASSNLGLQIVRTLVTDDLKGTLVYRSAEEAAEDFAIAAAQGEAGSASTNGASDDAPEGENDLAALAGRGARVIVTFPKRAISADSA